MAKTGQQGGGDSSSPSSHSRIVYLLVLAIVVPFAAAIGQIMTGPNKHVSSQQRNQDIMTFLAVGVSAALGLAAYVYLNKRNNRLAANNDDDDGDSSRNGGKNNTNSSSKKKPSTFQSSTAGARPKDIWKAGENKHASLKKPKAAYTEKPFGSKYYYAHNDSKTTGGYKDGLTMEDYRMNGPRLLSVNGLSVDNNNNNGNGDDGQKDDSNDYSKGETTETNADVAPPTRINAHDTDVKNITKYLWDDPGNGKGIATIRVDVLPGEKFGEFVDFGDVNIQDVTATLPGEGLMAKITVVGKETPSYQLNIKKLYGDAADVKVIVKPKRLLIKVYKKRHGFLSKNDNNLGSWPQPHRKI